MLNVTYAMKILDAMLDSKLTDRNTYGSKDDPTGEKGTISNVSFPANPYLALFTEMPDANGAGGVECSYSGYFRIPLRANGIGGTNLISEAVSESEDVKDDSGTVVGTINVAKIRNQELIVFPENEDDATDEVVGFGIFPGKDPTTNGTATFWSDVVDAVTGEPTKVEISKGNVPLIRVENFEISLA